MKLSKSIGNQPRARLIRVGLPLVVIGLVLVIGTKLLAGSQAATSTSSLEAETGSLVAPAVKLADGSAAGSAAIKFGTNATDNATITGWGSPVWRDEFTYKNALNQPAIDPSKWNIRTRANLGLLFDAAEPSADMVSVDSQNILHLRAKWLDKPYTRTNPPANSAAVITHKTGYIDQRKLKSGDVGFEQRYGRWEMRAKVASGPGTYGSLNAFWLRNNNSGEIDIMEAWGYGVTPRNKPDGGQRPGSFTTTIFNSTTTGAGKKFWRPANATNVYNDFHTWTLEFMPTYFKAYYDGQLFVSETPASSPDLWNPAYWGTPNHVRLNLHVGPNDTYWGRPDPNHKEWTQDAKMDFQVDYVRIWAPKK